MTLSLHSYTGSRTDFLDNNDGNVRTREVQDVSKILQLNAMYRSNESQFARPRNMNLFASLPPLLVVKLKREDNVDIFRMNKDPAMTRKFRRLMQYKYKDFKATERIHL